ncbi:MAG: hypothetical protein KJP07_10130 [Desulfatitalea sp.]|nr:hypothetical protein [Desulfatitalea sp.]
MTEKADAKKKARERDMSGFWKVDKLFRVDPPYNGFGHMDWLNEDEKALGAEWLRKFMTPPEGYEFGIGKGTMPRMERLLSINAFYSWLSDPEAFGAFFEYYDSCISLATGFNGFIELMQAGSNKEGIDAGAKGSDPEARRKFGNVMLMIFAVAFERKDDYFLRTMSCNSTQIEPDENGSNIITAEKAVMIHNPDSSVWSDEESLAIKFANAVMRSEMTDEIWDSAMEAWGLKQITRYAMFIGVYNIMLMQQNIYFRSKVW